MEPFGATKDTSSSATVAPKLFVTPSSRIERCGLMAGSGAEWLPRQLRRCQ